MKLADGLGFQLIDVQELAPLASELMAAQRKIQKCSHNIIGQIWVKLVGWSMHTQYQLARRERPYVENAKSGILGQQRTIADQSNLRDSMDGRAFCVNRYILLKQLEMPSL